MARLDTLHRAGAVVTILDRLQKARLEVNDLKNTAARALYAIDKAIEEATPTPTPTPVPVPDPDPVTEPPPVGDGETWLGEIKTPTGGFQAFDLGPIPDGTAYRIDDDALLVRWPDGDGTIDEIKHTYKGTLFTVLPGSIKSLGKRLVEADPERLLKAVKDGRCLPYSIRAFDGWGRTPTIKAEPEVEYRPDWTYGRSGMNNSVAYALTGAGGEYGSSRGFLAADDCHMVMGAIDGNEEQYLAAAEDCFSDGLYGLSIPNLAIWSQNHDCLRDPQTPLPGDRAYTNEGSRSGADDYGNEGKLTFPADADPEMLAALGAVAGTTYSHTRDEAHLFNHGFAYWLASGDPRFAILQQAIAAYALAAEYRGPYPDGRTRTRFGYQRATINMWTAAWKLRDVAMHTSGPLLWDKERSLRHANGVITDWKAQLAEMDAATDIYNRASSIFRGIDNGVNANDSAYSNFMIQQYGPEAAYLWARAGEPAMLTRIAENMVLRFLKIGGTRGVYGKGSGSGFRLLEDGKLPYDDADGLVRWTNEGNSLPNDSFDGAAQHTVQRAYWSLRMAADATARGWMAPVAGVHEAIAAIETARAKKAPTKDLSVVGVKHGGVTWAI